MANVPTWNQALPDPGFYTQDALRKATEYRERQAARVAEQEAAIKQAQHEADSRPFDMELWMKGMGDKYGKEYAEYLSGLAQKDGFTRSPFGDDRKYMTGYDVKALQERIKSKKDLMELDSKERVASLSNKLFDAKQKLEGEQRALGIDPKNPQATQLSIATPKLQKIQDDYNKTNDEYKKAVKMWSAISPEESNKFLQQQVGKAVATEHATVRTPSDMGQVLDGLVPTVERYIDPTQTPLDTQTAKALEQTAQSTIRGIVGHIKDYPDNWNILNEDDKSKLKTAVAGLDIGTDQDKQRSFNEILGVLARYETTIPLFHAFQKAESIARNSGSRDAPRIFTDIWEAELQRIRGTGNVNPKVADVYNSTGLVGLQDKETALRMAGNEMGNRNLAPASAATTTPATRSSTTSAGLPKVPATMGDWGPGQGAPFGTAAATAPPPASDNSLAGVPLGDNTVGDNTVKKEAAPPPPPKTRQETKDAYLDERMNVWVSKDHKWMWVPKYKSNKPPYGIDPKTRKPLMEQVYEKVPYNPNYVKPNPGIFRS